ncbi:MAG TPA: hypothetical protein VFE11_04085 [Dongiaceae bacterium]|jgi:hypothetical protein|nr:hypothetical protein [Dongiaceae bacterium]
MQAQYANTLVKLLDECVSGRVDSTTISAALRDIDFGGDDLLNSALHALHHFVADADLRSRDAKYRAIQLARLKQYADRIRAEYPSDAN